MIYRTRRPAVVLITHLKPALRHTKLVFARRLNESTKNHNSTSLIRTVIAKIDLIVAAVILSSQEIIWGKIK